MLVFVGRILQQT